MAKSRKYYNEIQELKGNIRVYCRVRPLSSDEEANGETYSTSFPEEDTVTVTHPTKGEKKTFEFERVYAPGSTQGN